MGIGYGIKRLFLLYYIAFRSCADYRGALRGCSGSRRIGRRIIFADNRSGQMKSLAGLQPFADHGVLLDQRFGAYSVFFSDSIDSLPFCHGMAQHTHSVTVGIVRSQHLALFNREEQHRA